MIIAFLIMLGFQNTIKDKIYDFAGHLQITRYVIGNSYNEEPAILDTVLVGNGIARVQPVAYKFGLLQNDEEVEGIIFKGVNEIFDSIGFKEYMVAGRFVNFDSATYSREIVISQREADKMRLQVGSDIIMHFIQSPPRSRKLAVVGIYSTGMEEFDDKLIIGDLGLVQRLNDWPDSVAGGYEVFLDDPQQTEAVYNDLFDALGYDLFVQKTSDKYIQVFEWLSLINNNVNILLFMVLFVASFNMISIILILILERTNMIGTLKALGAQDSIIRRIFVYSGMRLVIKGLILGNLLGLAFAAIQYHYQVIPLDPTNYYMSFVPIEFNWTVIVLLNLLVFMLVSAILIIPTVFITRISPIKAIRFD
jgi:lipoprotein-releasing system permease protein